MRGIKQTGIKFKDKYFSMIQPIKFKTPPLKFIDGKPCFILDEDYHKVTDNSCGDFIARLKSYLRSFPQLYSFIVRVISPALFVGKPPRSIFHLIPPDGLVAEIGSGSRRLRADIINIDIYPWSEVDVIADAQDLPFLDGTLDGVICSEVLEHLPKPNQTVKEISRILKRGGYAYISMPFIMPLHPSPKDYYRWTTYGLKELFSEWDIIEIKPMIGPTSAFLFVFQEWLSLTFSFNNRVLKNFFWIVLLVTTSPLKILDFLLVRYKFAEIISLSFYAIVRKK